MFTHSPHHSLCNSAYCVSTSCLCFRFLWTWISIFGQMKVFSSDGPKLGHVLRYFFCSSSLCGFNHFSVGFIFANFYVTVLVTLSSLIICVESQVDRFTNENATRWINSVNSTSVCSNQGCCLTINTRWQPPL